MTLVITPELIKPKLLFLTRFTPKLSLQSCLQVSPSAANTMLGICYLLWHCVAMHVGAVLWSAVLHAPLYSTQPLQLLQLYSSWKWDTSAR